MPKKQRSHSPQLSLFPPIHRSFRRLHRARRPSLYLNETKCLAFPPDQIDLTPASLSSPVPGDDRVTAPPQKVKRHVLALPSRPQM